ncbi:MAG: protein kinase [Myxococcales bacterium]|nr:protein kinase [Myxococcales bacterium]
MAQDETRRDGSTSQRSADDAASESAAVSAALEATVVGVRVPARGNVHANIHRLAGRRYEPLRRLGSGGMGEVVAARDTWLRRVVAVKTLQPDLAGDHEAEAHFLAEAQVAAQLEHPGVVPFYSLERTVSGSLAHTMRLIEGTSLYAYLKACAEPRAGRAPEGHGPERDTAAPDRSLEARLRVIAAVCDALAYAHERGVVHRDVKPHNVVLGPEGGVYLFDWGVARVQHKDAPGAGQAASAATAVGAPVSTSWVEETEIGEVVGTLRYMAPEQARGLPDAVGPKSDQFSVGMLLHEAITLRRPRTAKSAAEAKALAIRGARERLVHDDGSPVHPALAAIVERATDPNPGARYPDVQALGNDILAFVRGLPVSALRESPGQRIVRAAARHPERAVAAVVGALILLAALFAWGTARRVEARRQATETAVAQADLVAAVLRRGDLIEARLDATRQLVTELAATTEALLYNGRPADVPIYTAADVRAGDAPADYAFDARYGKKVTFEHPVSVLAAGVERADVLPFLRRLGALDTYLREILVRSVDPRAPRLPLAAQVRLLRERGAPLRYAAVAFENGVLLNFPGYGDAPESYDPRRRPWYRFALDADVARWGKPYESNSAKSVLFPCYVGLRDKDGARLGVAGADVALGDMTALLAMPRIAGFNEAYLVDRDGQVIVNTRDSTERQTGAPQLGGRTLAQPRLEDAALRAAVGAADQGALLDVGPHRYVVAPLADTNLVFVVQLTRYRAERSARAAEAGR